MYRCHTRALEIQDRDARLAREARQKEQANDARLASEVRHPKGKMADFGWVGGMITGATNLPPPEQGEVRLPPPLKTLNPKP